MDMVEAAARCQRSITRVVEIPYTAVFFGRDDVEDTAWAKPDGFVTRRFQADIEQVKAGSNLAADAPG